MRIARYRNEDLKIDDENKVVHFSIRKPTVDGSFTLNDKLMLMIPRGYDIHIHIKGSRKVYLIDQYCKAYNITPWTNRSGEKFVLFWFNKKRLHVVKDKVT